MSNGSFVPAERKEGGENGEPQHPKITSSRRGEISRSSPEANSSDSAGSRSNPKMAESSRVLSRPRHSHREVTGNAVSAAWSAGTRLSRCPPPLPRTWHPWRRDPRPRRDRDAPSQEGVGAVTLSDGELRPLPGAGGSSPGAPSARPLLPQAPNLLLGRISLGSSC